MILFEAGSESANGAVRVIAFEPESESPNGAVIAFEAESESAKGGQVIRMQMASVR